MLKTLVQNYTLLILGVLCLILPSLAKAQVNGTLTWEPGENSSHVAYYKVYYGHESRDYHKTMDVQGNTTSMEIPNLQVEKCYFFAVTAYDRHANESAFSEELAVYLYRIGDKISLLAVDWNEEEYLEKHPKAAQAIATGTVDSGFEYYVHNEYEQPRIEASVEGHPHLTEKTLETKRPGNLLFGMGGYSGLHGWVAVADQEYHLLDAFQVGWPAYIEAQGETRVCTGDVDGDGQDEVIIGLGPTDADKDIPAGLFEILDHDYSHLTWGQVQWMGYNEVNGETWPCTGDLNGDGKDEIIIGLGQQGQGLAEVFEYTEQGQLVHKDWVQSDWQAYNEVNGQVRPASGDLDGDMRDEIIFGFSQVTGDALLSGGQFQIIDGESKGWGQLQWPEYTAVNGEICPAGGDVDGDGRDEVLLGLGAKSYGRVGIMKYHGQSLTHLTWLDPPYDIQDPSLGTRVIASDFDQDTREEILVSYDSDSSDWLAYHEDFQEDLSLFQEVELWPERYQISDGMLWPAFQYKQVEQ